jgi:hypothetical protein
VIGMIQSLAHAMNFDKGQADARPMPSSAALRLVFLAFAMRKT